MTTPAIPGSALSSTSVVLSRSRGCVLASAAGDALGAPYELDWRKQARIPPPPSPVPFTSSDAWARGEWTDDTAMAVPLLEAAAAGVDVRTAAGLSHIVRRWMKWASPGPSGGSGKGIGRQTFSVFQNVWTVLGIHDWASLETLDLSTFPIDLGAECAAQAKAYHEASGRSAGNGALMRVGPLALGYFGDATGLAEAARAQSRLTHWEEDAGDAAVLWSTTIRQAILTGEANLREALVYLPEDRCDIWTQRIDEAEANTPGHFAERNTWVVAALQGAWAAFRAGAAGEGAGVKAILEAAVRGGGDTDTVGAIAGALAGAVYGEDSVPQDWRDALHGWPGYTGDDLRDMTDRAVARYSTAA